MMRTLLLFAVIVLSSYAQSAIDQQIEKIRHASAQERYRLMNALKKHLVNLHKQERLKVIERLKKAVMNGGEEKGTALSKVEKTADAKHKSKDPGKIAVPKGAKNTTTIVEHETVSHEMRSDIVEKEGGHDELEREDRDE